MPSGVYERIERTEEHKKHLSEAQKGKHHSEESKRKMSEAHKGSIPWNKDKKGQIPWNKGKKGQITWNKGKKCPQISKAHKGKHHSEKTKQKMSEATGSKNNNWKGGISFKKEYGGFMDQRRRIRKLNNGGSHILGDWENLKAQYNWTCPVCGKSEPNIKLTEDHIIPLSKGGSDNIENIQPLCQSCNSKKHTRIFRINPDKSRRLF